MVQAATKTYFAILHKDRGSAVGVVFPDLRGCYSAGETYDEAIVNAGEALRLYAQAEQDAGRSLPPPRLFEDLLADNEVKAETTSAAFVAIQLAAVEARMEGQTRANGGRISRSVDTGYVAPLSVADGVRAKPAAKARKKKSSSTA